MSPDEAKKIDPNFRGDVVVQEVRILLSEDEVLASKLVMTCPQQWASNEVHKHLNNVITSVVNQYVAQALENNWDVPPTKIEILRKAIEHTSDIL